MSLSRAMSPLHFERLESVCDVHSKSEIQSVIDIDNRHSLFFLLQYLRGSLMLFTRPLDSFQCDPIHQSQKSFFTFATLRHLQRCPPDSRNKFYSHFINNQRRINSSNQSEHSFIPCWRLLPSTSLKLSDTRLSFTFSVILLSVWSFWKVDHLGIHHDESMSSCLKGNICIWSDCSIPLNTDTSHDVSKDRHTKIQQKINHSSEYYISIDLCDWSKTRLPVVNVMSFLLLHSDFWYLCLPKLLRYFLFQLINNFDCIAHHQYEILVLQLDIEKFVSNHSIIYSCNFVFLDVRSSSVDSFQQKEHWSLFVSSDLNVLHKYDKFLFDISYEYSKRNLDHEDLTNWFSTRPYSSMIRSYAKQKYIVNTGHPPAQLIHIMIIGTSLSCII